MSVLWTSDAAAKATGGEAVSDWQATGLSIDTRTLQPGDLFIPLKDVRDGHEFIPTAYERGAAAVISEKQTNGKPALLVKDALHALEDLARSKRQIARRVAVTGSVGKTSVKEMIACICRAAGKTHASVKSYNNHWGVPLTMAGMPDDTEYGVFEMGMNHAGELDALSKIVEPHIAVITKIAPAHLAHFDSLDEIAAAKSEVFNGVFENGVAIVPDQSGYMDLFKKAIANKTGVKLVSFGSSENADARIISTIPTMSGSLSKLVIAGQEIELSLPVIGSHWVENAACALLSSHCLGVNLEIAANALKCMDKIPGRGEVHSIDVKGKSIKLIDESYNANPESMRAAISALGLYAGRKIAVLGDMLELGDAEDELHAGLCGHVINHGVDLVLSCGSRMRALDDVLPNSLNAGWSEGHEAAFSELLAIIQDGDVVMIKGSNASGMSKIVAALIEKNNPEKNRGEKANVL